MMTLTHANRKNLAKLADYLEGLPEDYDHFDMSIYLDAEHGNEPKVIEYAKKNGGVASCGTVACAVGHGPAAGILFRGQDFHENWRGQRGPNWSKYSERFTAEYSDYRWAFAGAWGDIDNHHWGAAARIRYLLKNGGPPEGFIYPDSEEWLQHYEAYRAIADQSPQGGDATQAPSDRTRAAVAQPIAQTIPPSPGA